MRSLLILLFALCTTAHADDGRPDLFAAMKWRMIGPFRGGRVLAVTGVPGQPNHFYSGSVDGGVWETQDAGRTWQPIFDAMPIGSIGAIAVAPSNPKVIYVGAAKRTCAPISATETACTNRSMAAGHGRASGLSIHIRSGGSWWIHTTRICCSLRRWVTLMEPTRNAECSAAQMAAHRGRRSYIRMRTRARSILRLVKIQKQCTQRLADATTTMECLPAVQRPRHRSVQIGGRRQHLDPADRSRVSPKGSAGSGSLLRPPIRKESMRSWMQKQADCTGRMIPAQAGPMFQTIRAFLSVVGIFGGITVDPKNSDVVYSCDVALYKSADGGKTFLPVRGAPGGDDYHALWIDPNDSNRMITGADQGAVVTLNGGGLTWSSWHNQATGQFYHVITDHQFPYRVYGAQQDSGAAAVPSRTTNFNGMNMMQFREVTAGGESGNIAPDPLNPRNHLRRQGGKTDTRTEQTEDVDPTFAYPDIYRSEWTLPLVFSPRDPRVLYFANQVLFQHRGRRTPLDAPQFRPHREQLTIPPNLDPVTAVDTETRGPRRGVIYAIAPSPIRDHLIWTGTDDGLIWLTLDEGATGRTSRRQR